MNIPYLNRYRHSEYLQYMKDILQLLNDQDLEVLQLTNQKNTLEPIVNQIDEAFIKGQGSTLTQEIITLDDRRDRAIIGLRGIVSANTYHFEEAQQLAAKALMANIAAHGDNIARLSYQEETAVLDSIVKDWEGDSELSAAVQLLGVGNWLAELKTANQAFSQKYLERVNETAASDAANIPTLRGEATEAYRTLVNHIQAHATLSALPAYNTILSQIDVLAEQYNQVVNNRSNGNNTVNTDNTNV